MQEVRYSVVVPVYKSERSVRELYERTDKTFGRIQAEYELILVEDGGGDASWEVMRSLRDKDKRVKIVRLTRNFGQHNALMCGFSFASGDYIVTMDDDLQNPPEEIPRLIQAIQGKSRDSQPMSSPSYISIEFNLKILSMSTISRFNYLRLSISYRQLRASGE